MTTSEIITMMNYNNSEINDNSSYDGFTDTDNIEDGELLSTDGTEETFTVMPSNVANTHQILLEIISMCEDDKDVNTSLRSKAIPRKVKLCIKHLNNKCETETAAGKKSHYKRVLRTLCEACNHFITDKCNLLFAKSVLCIGGKKIMDFLSEPITSKPPSRLFNMGNNGYKYLLNKMVVNLNTIHLNDVCYSFKHYLINAASLQAKNHDTELDIILKAILSGEDVSTLSNGGRMEQETVVKYLFPLHNTDVKWIFELFIYAVAGSNNNFNILDIENMIVDYPTDAE